VTFNLGQSWPQNGDAMKPGSIVHTVAVLLSSVTSLFSQSTATQVPAAKMKLSKKSSKHGAGAVVGVDPIAYTPAKSDSPKQKIERFSWRRQIVTTVFWIGEKASGNNPTPNHASCWDKNWGKNYGGFDDPNPAHRRGLIPARFTPRQNPFYCALPYNDKASTGHRAEASRVVPWFKEQYQGPAVSTCKGHWIAIRRGSKTVYAQWEDAGPFRTDHWQYVFGNDRPKPNLNKGAGLDVSPAIRDYLGLQATDVTDWKFVDFDEVPPGPWTRFGDNNTFVINERKGALTQALRAPESAVSR
jgi:hypothetical protein